MKSCVFLQSPEKYQTCFLWHASLMGQPLQPQPQDERPFFLSLTSAATATTTIAATTRSAMTVAAFETIHYCLYIVNINEIIAVSIAWQSLIIKE